MSKDELKEQLELIYLLLKDVQKKYSFLDENKLRQAIKQVLKEIE